MLGKVISGDELEIKNRKNKSAEKAHSALGKRIGTMSQTNNLPGKRRKIEQDEPTPEEGELGMNRIKRTQRGVFSSASVSGGNMQQSHGSLSGGRLAVISEMPPRPITRGQNQEKKAEMKSIEIQVSPEALENNDEGPLAGTRGKKKERKKRQSKKKV